MAEQIKLPTLADVAHRAGVSTATVSRCLNDPEKLGEATRKRVMQVILDLGYSPNFGARALAAKRTNTVGAVIPTMDNAIFARGLQAFERELHAQGMTLLVASSDYDPNRELEQIRNLVARGADALLLIGYDRDPAIYDFLNRQSVPYVLAWAYDAAQQQAAIGFDNRRAFSDLTRHVMDLGHRRLGLITAPTKTNDRARERVLGAKLAMQDAGLNPDDLVIAVAKYSVTGGGHGFEQIITAAPDVTAVLCGNDVLGVGAVKRAKAMGLRVPEDISITGFDNIELATICDPELTTVHVPHAEMGRQAAQYLVGILRNGQGLAPTLPIPTEMRLRGSLARVMSRT